MPVLLAPAAAEIFGGRYSGEIYRRLWLTVPLANFLGTTVMSKARDAAYTRHATSLAADVDADSFLATFGAPHSELASLIANKTVTLPLLLKISPEGTVDPSPFLYNDVFYGIAGCSALALAEGYSWARGVPAEAGSPAMYRRALGGTCCICSG